MVKKQINEKKKYWSVYNDLYCSWSKIRSALPTGHFEVKYLDNQRYRFELLVNIIAQHNSKTEILDIGPSPFTLILRRLFPESKIATLDMTEYLKPLCESWDVDFQLVNLGKDNLPWEEGAFDIIILGEVLEHIASHPGKILRECFRVLKPGGILIITTPNFASLENRIKLAAGQHIQEYWVENDIPGRIHYREYLKSELEREVKHAGFSILKSKYARYWETPGNIKIVLGNRLTNKDSRITIIKASIFSIAFIVYSFITWCIPQFRRSICIIANRS
jgi:SAM-dependent methyltransferase